MKELIEKYKLAQEEVYKIYHEISNFSDGYIYFTKLRSYGSISWGTYKNEFLVQQLCDEYYDGYDGIVEVYTNNPNHQILSYEEVQILTIEELEELSKENVSMTAAICNWISKTL